MFFILYTIAVVKLNKTTPHSVSIIVVKTDQFLNSDKFVNSYTE